MVASKKHIDRDQSPELAEITEKSLKSGESVDLRVAGRKIAELIPTPAPETNESTQLTTEERARFIAESGGWIGLVDTEKLRRDNELSRSLTSSPPAEL